MPAAQPPGRGNGGPECSSFRYRHTVDGRGRRPAKKLTELHVTGQALHPERSTSGLCPGHPRRSSVWMVSQPTTEGVAVCVRDQVEAAVRSGYRVTLACPEAGDLVVWATEHGAEWERVEMRRSPHLSDFAAIIQVRRLARSHALVLLHSSKAGAVGRIALASLWRRRPPSVFSPHGWSWLAGGRFSPPYRLTERILLPVTTAVVAVSGEERSAGRATLGVGRWPSGQSGHRG